ncbi:MAG: hypothetical protein Ct9H300mP14_08910 [Gammaproteobacteria bacterium]|nr:MAG: hypothetical protein Ct9H300mP14_08910 [Gammaproteobacteria bacterium]
MPSAPNSLPHLELKSTMVLSGSKILNTCLYRSGHSGQFLQGKCGACGILTAWISDHPGKVTNQKNDFVAQVLKLAHFVDQYCMTQV